MYFFSLRHNQFERADAFKLRSNATQALRSLRGGLQHPLQSGNSNLKEFSNMNCLR
jgi:hypothetical protein